MMRCLWKTYRIHLFLCLGAALWSLAVGCEERGARVEGRARVAPAKVGLDGSGHMRPSAEDRCPVCAMEVSGERPFLSAIVERDGATHYFCGTGCMIKAWHHPEVYLGVGREALRKAVVREYFGGEHIDAAGAYFVGGSDVVGPMGPAIVPLKTAGDVETFRARHGGAAPLRLEELTDERLEALTGARASRERRR